MVEPPWNEKNEHKIVCHRPSQSVAYNMIPGIVHQFTIWYYLPNKNQVYVTVLRGHSVSRSQNFAVSLPTSIPQRRIGKKGGERERETSSRLIGHGWSKQTSHNPQTHSYISQSSFPSNLNGVRLLNRVDVKILHLYNRFDMAFQRMQLSQPVRTIVMIIYMNLVFLGMHLAPKLFNKHRICFLPCHICSPFSLFSNLIEFSVTATFSIFILRRMKAMEGPLRLRPLKFTIFPTEILFPCKGNLQNGTCRK